LVREGLAHYAINAELCGSYSLVFGHVTSVTDRLATAFRSPDCDTNVVLGERIESCVASVDVEVAAGETLGSVGARTVNTFELGLYDELHENFFVKPERYSYFARTAICPYDPLPPDERGLWLGRLMHGVVPASGESPVCGSVSVDVAGSAQGVWVLQSNPVNQSSGESGFVVLAPHPMYPESSQTFSIGPAAIAGPLETGDLDRYPLAATSRVNRPFSEVLADGLIHCYVHERPSHWFSYFVRLAPGDVLTLQRVSHSPAVSPCGNDPATWQFGPGALSFIR
jgi:hypothetical protein